MKIVIDASDVLRLEDAESFNQFKIIAPAALLGSEHLAQQIGALGKMDENGNHAWVSISKFLTLFGSDRSDTWRESFRKMIESAAKYGFLNADRDAFRSHIDLL